MLDLDPLPGGLAREPTELLRGTILSFPLKADENDAGLAPELVKIGPANRIATVYLFELALRSPHLQVLLGLNHFLRLVLVWLRPKRRPQI